LDSPLTLASIVPLVLVLACFVVVCVAVGR
jgi:hypothetical protein